MRDLANPLRYGDLAHPHKHKSLYALTSDPLRVRLLRRVWLLVRGVVVAHAETVPAWACAWGKSLRRSLSFWIYVISLWWC